MIHLCLTCRRHGPPLTTYENHEPCKRCVTEPGFPLWEELGEYATGYVSPIGEKSPIGEVSPTGGNDAKTEPESAP